MRKRACLVCWHYPEYEEGEVCGICGHRMAATSEELLFNWVLSLLRFCLAFSIWVAMITLQGLSFLRLGASPGFSMNKHFSQFCSQSVPRYIIAFRGTLIRQRTCTSDIKLDIRVILHHLCVSSQYQVAIQAVEKMVAKHGHSNLWLTGHSLGLAIALQVGKDMATKEIFLETYLFNPPIPITPIERLRSQRLKDGLRYARSLITARLATAVKRSESLDRDDQYDASFVKLSSWIPHLFVNPGDPLCAEYIGYFEHRVKMAAMGAAPIERVASQNSLVSLVSWAIGKLIEPTHLIPSACLAINRSSSGQQSFKQAHGINQWWKPDQDIEFKLYQLS